VELVNAGDDGSIGVAVCGKNLLNSGFISSWFTALPTTSTGSVRPFTIAAGTYTISAATNTGVFRSNVFAVDLQDANGNRVKAINGTSVGGTGALNDSVTFSLSDDEAKRIAKIHVYYNAQTDTARTDGEHLTEIQIEYGAEATEYEPYVSGGALTLSTPNGLPGIPVASGGNYTDESGQMWLCDEVDFEKGVYVQRLGKLVYDGSDDETWIVTGTRYRIAVPGMLEHTDATVAPPVMCDKYITVNPNTNYAGTISISAQQWGDAVVLLVKNDDLADVSAFKASLAEKPMKVLVALAAPVETPLAAEEIAAYAALRTNKPTANVMNDSGAGMQLDYSADTKLYIDNKFAALAAAMIANA